MSPAATMTLTSPQSETAHDASARRGFLLGATAAAAGAFSLARPGAAQAEEPTYVLSSHQQAADTFLPVFTRTPAERPAGAHLGFYTGTTTYGGTVDPFVSLGYYAPLGTDWTSALQLEADWDCAPAAVHITELYWQLIKPDGSSRRPFYGKYDRSEGRAVSWDFMVGAGTSDTGRPRPGFFVNWDNDSSPVGVGMFAVQPNRLSVHAITSGGVAAENTRLRMYSAPGKGSGVALTFDGKDAEGYFHPTLVLETVSPTQTVIRAGGVYAGALHKPSPTQPTLRLESGIQVGDGAARAALWSSASAPTNALGRNGDWCFTQTGDLFFKKNGDWVNKRV